MWSADAKIPFTGCSTVHVHHRLKTACMCAHGDITNRSNFFFSNNCFIFTDKISDSDIREISKHLGPFDLRRLYYSPVLGLKKEAVEKAEYDARFETCDIRAWRVLGMWQQQKASEATRGKVLKALEECGCWDAMGKLAEKWNLKGRNLIKY